ncbi:MAG: competence protein ComK [Bulleidia sp.]
MKQILTVQYDTGAQQTRVLYHGGGEVFREGPSLRLIAEWCLAHGSSIDGRRESFRYYTGAVQKIPVLVSEKPLILLMPVLSPERNPDCLWISYEEILKVKAPDDWHMNILFTDGTAITAEVSPKVLRLQMKRCRQFLKGVQAAEKSA